jgi:hypothetical protein
VIWTLGARYDGASGRREAGAACGAGIEVTRIATTTAVAGTSTIAGEENAGSCAATTSCETLWQFLSCASWVGSAECVGQWQRAGSGQQHGSLIVVTVRSCETGTASATTIATNMAAAAFAIRRIFTLSFAHHRQTVSTRLIVTQ